MLPRAAVQTHGANQPSVRWIWVAGRTNRAAADQAALTPRAASGRAFGRNLAGYKVPREVIIADPIRRSPTAKAEYVWAKEFAAEQLAA